MEANARVGPNGLAEMIQVQQCHVQTRTGDGDALVLFNPDIDGDLPHPVYMIGTQVMSDEQVESLRRQISVYSTICKQLVDMHRATLDATQNSLAGMMVGQHIPYDSLMTANHKTTAARQRWTPSQTQLMILEKLFDQGNGTPNKTRIKEITADLSQHGQIAETNVYNWFQNRKARAKRKQQVVSPKDGESEIDTDNDSPKAKKHRLDKDSGQEYSNSGGRAETGGHSSDGGVQYEQKPNSLDQYDQQESASSVHMHSHADSTQGAQTFGRPGPFDVFSKGGALEMSQLGILMEGKSVDIQPGVLDLKGSFGESALLMDSRGHNGRTDDAGMSFQGLHAVDSFRLAKGLAEGVSGVPLPGEGMHNLHQVVGMMNNGLGNGSMLRMQAQI